MKNIPLRVNIESQTSKVNTDWLAIMATLKKRGLEQDELASVYFDLNAGMRVTTRGLSLAKITMTENLEGIIKEPTVSTTDFAAMANELVG
ncbi:hypothetical protein [Shewanella surugensis]|uniref:Uncharacterized protein n=1 Tax=Shewanella surugensis TaxID=212020 RepID=A0ABT0LA22_9GAMM|nr:hypothetical protein [Shewanella surugensis]MCL1124490.1 hypothetical protein [Shewanella surugensis]